MHHFTALLKWAMVLDSVISVAERGKEASTTLEEYTVNLA